MSDKHNEKYELNLDLQLLPNLGLEFMKTNACGCIGKSRALCFACDISAT
jgi:hypothetical protein